MEQKRRFVLSAGIVAIAMGAGHLVQSNAGGSARQAAAAPTGIVPLSARAEPDPAPVPAPVAVAAATPRAASPAAPDPAPVAAAAVAKAPTPVLADATAQAAQAPGPVAKPATAIPVRAEATPAPAAPAPDSCAAKLSTTAMPGAVLSLALVAPCDGGARVVLRHGGLAVTGKLSAAGTLFTTLPAMEPKGEVAAMFSDGTKATAAAAADMAGIRRFAVQWQADDAFQLQVYENGAAFGAPGNVSAATPVGEGQLSLLGDASVDLPMLAQVYTWPAAATPVNLTVEAAVTAKTCARELLGEAVESDAGKVTATDITLAMPGCDALGDFLVLNNLAGQTTLAAAD